MRRTSRLLAVSIGFGTLWLRFGIGAPRDSILLQDHLQSFRSRGPPHGFSEKDQQDPRYVCISFVVALESHSSRSGEYFADLLRAELQRLEASESTEHVEWRISIYGRSRDEWEELSQWATRYNLLGT